MYLQQSHRQQQQYLFETTHPIKHYTGGRIVFTYTSIYKDLASHKGIYDDNKQHTQTCRGSYLFLDIPDLMPNMTRGLPDDVSREYVLVTSPDVLFLQDINSCNLGTPEVWWCWITLTITLP